MILPSRRTALLASLLVTTALCLSACGDPAQREARYLRRGTQLFEKGDYEKARLEFKNAARIKPTDPEVRYRLGLIDEAQSDLHAAFVNFHLAADQNGHYRPALVKLAQYYIGAGQFDQAEERVAVVLADTPDDPDGHGLRGSIALRRNDPDAAEKEARFAIAKDPSNVFGLTVLAGVYTARGDKDQAIKVLDQGLAKNPKEVRFNVVKISIYQKFDDKKGVVDTYEALIRSYPAELKYRRQLAQFYIDTKQTDEAEKVYRALVDAAPQDLEAKKTLIAFLSEQRGLEPAESQLHAFMKAEPNQDEYYFWLVDLYVRYQAVDKAVALLNEVVDRERFEPPGLAARTTLARISFARGDRGAAQKLIGMVLEKDPSNVDALYMRAGVFYDTGQFQSAASDLRSILREKPRSVEVLQLLAETLIRQGRVDLAIENLSQLLAIDPSNKVARTRLAQMYNLTGDSRRSIELLDQLTTSAPDYAVAWESLARIAITDKNWALAARAIDKLETLPDQKLTATYLRGQVAAGNNQPEEAKRKFAEIIKVDPTTPLAEHALQDFVEISRRQGETVAAAHFLEALKADSPYIETLLGECYIENGDLDAAQKQFDAAIAGGSHRPEPYLGAARLAFKAQKDSAVVVSYLKKGMEAVPSDVQIPMTLADIDGRLGQYHEAVALYEGLLERVPDLDAAANNMAELIADYQSTDAAALEHARRIAERFQTSTNPSHLDTLGWVYYRQGKSLQALAILEHATSLADAPAQVHYHYGAALLAAGDKKRAADQLRLAVKPGSAYVGLDEAHRLLDTL